MNKELNPVSFPSLGSHTRKKNLNSNKWKSSILISQIKFILLLVKIEKNGYSTTCSWLFKWAQVSISAALEQRHDCETVGKKRAITTRKAKAQTGNDFSSILCSPRRGKQEDKGVVAIVRSFPSTPDGKGARQHCPQHVLRWNLDLLLLLIFKQISCQKSVF